MKRISLLLLCTVILACKSNREPDYNTDYKSTFDSILRVYDLKGTMLVLDPQQRIYYSNDFDWAKRSFLPASTFKIPNAIIALETGLLTDAETILKWDGQERDFETWEQDMSFKEAFRASCVPCFQEIAREIGEDRMKSYLNKLSYGQIKIQNDVDSFWLVGDSRISPFEQIDFLSRFYSKKLPILTSTRDQMLRILEIERDGDHRFSGKSGWSYKDENNNGWFVGFLEKGGKIYYFALNIEPMDAKNMQKFVLGREQAVRGALRALGLM